MNEPDPFWTHDEAVDELPVPGLGTRHVRLGAHLSEERTSLRQAREEIVPIELPALTPRGHQPLRDYAMLEFYYRQPRQILTVRLDGPLPGEDASVVGHVAGGPVQEGFSDWPIARVQAWRYRAGNILIFWEVVPQFRGGGDDPGADLRPWWELAEAWLLRRFAPTKIITPGWDPAYDALAWHVFLAQRGYAPNPAARLRPEHAWSKTPIRAAAPPRSHPVAP